MTKPRKNYSREFKENAVKLSFERSNVSDLARELGVRPNALYRWRDESQAKGKECFPENGKQSVTAEQEELLILRKKLIRKEMELEILKNAIANRKLKKNMLFHSDRGVQYCCKSNS
jgi:transposase